MNPEMVQGMSSDTYSVYLQIPYVQCFIWINYFCLVGLDQVFSVGKNKLYSVPLVAELFHPPLNLAKTVGAIDINSFHQNLIKNCSIQMYPPNQPKPAVVKTVGLNRAQP